MLIALTLAAATGLQTAVAPANPAHQTCSDGSVILATDRCITLTPHRYHLTHQPARREVTERWWCAGSPQPIEATVRFDYSYPVTAAGPTYTATLLSLIIEGRPAPDAVRDKLRNRLEAVDRVYDITGRCLFVQSGGAIGVLTLSYEGGRVEVELR